MRIWEGVTTSIWRLHRALDECSVDDGIARVYGLKNVHAAEMVELSPDLKLAFKALPH